MCVCVCVCLSTSHIHVAQIVGQLPKYLPLRRGFDAFLGLPFSVDDGQGFLSPCNESNEFSLSSGLGPSLPLPLIRQRSGNGKPAVSEIIEQPTDLRLLTARLLNFSLDFVETHANRFPARCVTHLLLSSTNLSTH